MWWSRDPAPTPSSKCSHLLKILDRAPDTDASRRRPRRAPPWDDLRQRPDRATTEHHEPKDRHQCDVSHCRRSCSPPRCRWSSRSRALLALTVRADFHEIGRAERSAELGGMWTPLSDALSAIEHGGRRRLHRPPRRRRPRSTPAAPAPTRRWPRSPQPSTSSALRRRRGHARHRCPDRRARRPHRCRRRRRDERHLEPDRPARVVRRRPPASSCRSVSCSRPMSDDADLGSELLAVVRLAGGPPRRRPRSSTPPRRWNTVYDDVTVLDRGPQLRYTELEVGAHRVRDHRPRTSGRTQYRQSGFAAAITDYRTQLDSVLARRRAAARCASSTSTGFSTLVRATA